MSNVGDKQNLFSKVGTVVAWVTLIFSVVTFVFWTIPTQKATRELAQTADARDATVDAQLMAAFAPKIEVSRFVAYSPDMTAEADEKAIQRAGLSTARVIPTPYQFRLASQGIPNPNMCYLFVVVANRGGNVEGMNIRVVRWESKWDQPTPMPIGVDEIPTLGALLSGQAYALLVDAAEGMSAIGLEASHVQDVCIAYTYTDSANKVYPAEDICISDMEIFMFRPQEPLEGGKWE